MVYEIIWKKYGAVGHTTHHNIIRRLLVARRTSRATHIHKHTLRICYKYFSTVKMFLRERSSMLCLYIHGLSSFSVTYRHMIELTQ